MKLKPELQALREMIEESAGWTHLAADKALCMKSASQLMFQCHCCSQRNGWRAGAVCFTMMTKRGDPRLRALVLAATVYSAWPRKCMELFGDVWPDRTRHWLGKSDKRMLQAVEQLLQDKALKVNPAVDELADGLRQKVASLATPLELWMADMKEPLARAVQRGASRDDLVRMVDEAIAESVMKA
jgi:hypothetical protein